MVVGCANDAGQPFVIVGGQAVNLWAERYRAHEPRLDAFRPFTSKDLDLVGTTAEARRVAAESGWEFVPPAPDAFVMQAKLRRGELLVEFLRPAPTLFPPVAARLTPQGAPGVAAPRPLPVRVLSPEELLLNKVALATDVPQEGVPGDGIAPRQDVRHVAMLALILPRYLEDVLAAITPATDAARRDATQPIVALLAGLKRSGSGRRFEAAHPGTLPWGGLLPAVVRALPFDAVHQRCLAELA